MSDTRLEYTRTWTNADDFPYLGFSRNWENPRDYPTFEPDEAVVRADMQSLHDETKRYINETLIPEMIAADATEKDRDEAEQARRVAESARVTAEQSRVVAEQSRVDAEQARVNEASGVVAQAAAQVTLAAEQVALAKGYAEKAASSVAGVSTFNGRQGKVVPKSGDYTADMVGAAPAVADATYKQCYYRMVGNEREWINPPMIPDTEYRTTERLGGKVVYKKNYAGSIYYRLEDETEWNAEGASGVSAELESHWWQVHQNKGPTWYTQSSDGSLPKDQWFVECANMVWDTEYDSDGYWVGDITLYSDAEFDTTTGTYKLSGARTYRVSGLGTNLPAGYLYVFVDGVKRIGRLGYDEGAAEEFYFGITSGNGPGIGRLTAPSEAYLYLPSAERHRVDAFEPVALVKSVSPDAYPHNSYDSQRDLFYEYLGIPFTNAINGSSDLMRHWWEVTKTYYDKKLTDTLICYNDAPFFSGKYYDAIEINGETGEITGAGRSYSEETYSPAGLVNHKGKYFCYYDEGWFYVGEDVNPEYVETDYIWVANGVKHVVADPVGSVELVRSADSGAYPHEGTVTVPGVAKYTYRYLGVPFGNALNITETRLAELEAALAEAKAAIAAQYAVSVAQDEALIELYERMGG